MKTTFLQGAVVGAVVASVTLVASVALAGSGIGGVFNLGATNNVNASSVLNGSTDGQQLRVVNPNTGAAATGVGIHTATNRPPLAVNSSAKVTNLNADLLDGVDSSELQTRVSGQCANGSAMSGVNADGTVSCTSSAVYPIYHSLGLGGQAFDTFGASGLSLGSECTSLSSVGLDFRNTGTSSSQVHQLSSTGVNTGVLTNTAGPGGSYGFGYPSATELAAQIIWTTTTGSLPFFTRYVVTLNIHQSNSASGCEFAGTAELATSRFRFIKKGR